MPVIYTYNIEREQERVREKEIVLQKRKTFVDFVIDFLLLKLDTS